MRKRKSRSNVKWKPNPAWKNAEYEIWWWGIPPKAWRKMMRKYKKTGKFHELRFH